MSDDETRDYVDKVEKALQEKVSDESAKPERFIVSHNEEYIVSFPGLARFLSSICVHNKTLERKIILIFAYLSIPCIIVNAN